MKIRSGFVSNSSSSSFIVGFNRRPKSVDELRKWMFGDGEYVSYYDYGMSTWEAAARVFKDIKEQKRPATVRKMMDEIRSGYFESRPPYNFNARFDLVEKEFKEKFPNEQVWEVKKPTDPVALALIEKYRKLQKEEWAEEEKRNDTAALNYANNTVLPKMEGKKVFIFSYADDGGEAVMEHGDIFQNFPHVQISHH